MTLEPTPTTIRAVPKPLSKKNGSTGKKSKRTGIRKLRPNKAKLDKLCGEIVRKRGKCENPACISRRKQTVPVLQWAHIVSRSYYTTRWQLDNAFCLCASCHMYFTVHPLEWEAFVTEKLGSSEYQRLKETALTYQKIDYVAIYEGLKAYAEST